MEKLTLFEMECQCLIELRQSVLKQLLHYKSDFLVDCLPFLLDKSIISYLLRQSMLEDILQIRLKRLCPDEVNIFQIVEASVNMILESCDPL